MRIAYIIIITIILTYVSLSWSEMRRWENYYAKRAAQEANQMTYTHPMGNATTPESCFGGRMWYVGPGVDEPALIKENNNPVECE